MPRAVSMPVLLAAVSSAGAGVSGVDGGARSPGTDCVSGVDDVTVSLNVRYANLVRGDGPRLRERLKTAIVGSPPVGRRQRRRRHSSHSLAADAAALEERGADAPGESPAGGQRDADESTKREYVDITFLEPLLARTRDHAVANLGRQSREEVDIVVSGGGLRGYYVTGAAAVLATAHHLRPVRYAGASAGAWCATFMACGLDTAEWVATFARTQRHLEDGMKILDAYRCFATDILPDDAHVRCSGRVFISVSVLGWTGLRNVIVSEFDSREDLIEACIASSNIPFITSNGLGARFRGNITFDGGPTNNTPVFTDGKRRQIVFNLGAVPYSLKTTLSPTDPCIEALVLRGAIEMEKFVKQKAGEGIQTDVPTGRGGAAAAPAIAWLNVSEASTGDDGAEEEEAHAATSRWSIQAFAKAPHRTLWYLLGRTAQRRIVLVVVLLTALLLWRRRGRRGGLLHFVATMLALRR